MTVVVTDAERTVPATERGRRTRERVVAAAHEVFVARGFNDTRMSDIAEQAGVSHGTVYVYFDSKADVLQAVVTQLLDDIAAELRVPQADDASDRIAAANLRYLRVYTAHGRLLRVVDEAGTADDSLSSLLDDFRARHVARVTDDIRRLQQEGRVADHLDANVAGAALSAMVEGYTRHSPGYDLQAAHATLTSLWLRALGLPDPQAGPALPTLTVCQPAATARGESP